MNNINEHELISAANHVELNFRHMGLTESPSDLFRHLQWEIEEYRETAPDSVERLHEAVDKVKDGEDYFESDVEEEEEEKRTCDNCEYRNVSADDVPCVNCTRTDGELDYWTKQIS